jgi:hypothetical protein
MGNPATVMVERLKDAHKIALVMAPGLAPLCNVTIAEEVGRELASFAVSN